MKSDYVFVDTETTGLNHDTDEILSVSVIDDEGICLFHSLIRPQHTVEWSEAEVNPKFSFKAHDSLEDCRATREVWDFLMTVPEIREKYRARA